MSNSDEVTRGAKCYLRSVRADDIDSFYRWYRDPDIQRNLANLWWNPAIDFETYQVHRFAQYLQPNPNGGVLVICANDARAIGLVNYFDYSEEKRSCEVGIIIGETGEWRRGYAFESLNLLLRFLDDKLRIRSVRARILTDNLPSQHLFTKVGFVKTGSSREERFEFYEYEYVCSTNSD